MAPAPPFVAVVIATFRRAPELERLLASLERVRTPLVVIVVDNAGDEATGAVLQAARVETVRLLPGCNLGCGGGLALGEREALERFGDRLTHLWILDDDTEVFPGALERLLAAMKSGNAALACPMIVNAQGNIGWFPGLLDRAAFASIRALRTPMEFLAHQGASPVRFSWATGVSILATREAVERCGLHRTDFWIRGEDLEFSLRITAQAPGIFVPDATVAHLSRPVTASPEALAEERRKHCALLQNVAFIGVRLPHGRRIFRTIPGNLWRFVKLWGAARLFEGLRVLWVGAVRGKPAGVSVPGGGPSPKPKPLKSEPPR